MGCSIATPRKDELIIYRGCDEKDHATIVETKVGFPGLECLALAVQYPDPITIATFVVGFPAIACATVGEEDANRIRYATIWLYPINFDFVVVHEREHVKGMRHPAMLPFIHYPSCS